MSPRRVKDDAAWRGRKKKTVGSPVVPSGGELYPGGALLPSATLTPGSAAEGSSGEQVYLLAGTDAGDPADWEVI